MHTLPYTEVVKSGTVTVTVDSSLVKKSGTVWMVSVHYMYCTVSIQGIQSRDIMERLDKIDKNIFNKFTGNIFIEKLLLIAFC